MKKLICRFILCVVFCLFAFVAVSAQDAKSSKEVKGKYQNIEVTKFDIKEGVEFPSDSLNVMIAEIVEELKQLNKFKQVTSANETKTDTNKTEDGAKTETDGATIRLSGTITKFKKGSRAKRYLIGFGAGTTKVVAHVKFIDTVTGNVLFEKDVDGKVIIGFFGGDSSGSTRGLAKEVAKVAKKKFF